MRKHCYVAVCSAALGASAPTEGQEVREHIVAAARLQLVVISVACVGWISSGHTGEVFALFVDLSGW